jgi:hypothetical protein
MSSASISYPSFMSVHTPSDRTTQRTIRSTSSISSSCVSEDVVLIVNGLSMLKPSSCRTLSSEEYRLLCTDSLRLRVTYKELDEEGATWLFKWLVMIVGRFCRLNTQVSLSLSQKTRCRTRTTGRSLNSSSSMERARLRCLCMGGREAALNTSISTDMFMAKSPPKVTRHHYA